MTQINEVSYQTLASYKKKAGAQATELDKRAAEKYEAGDIEAGKELTGKANKRFSGIVKATKKEFQKDLQKEELEEKKKQVVRDIIKKKTKGPDNYNPDPELSEKDTIVKT